jgi:hypothetical protein
MNSTPDYIPLQRYPTPIRVEVDSSPTDSWPEVPSVVAYVTRIFSEVSGIDLEAWHEHLIESPHAARNRVQWIRLAGIYQAYAPDLNRWDQKLLYRLLWTIPTWGKQMAWHIWHLAEIGMLSYTDIEAAYFGEAPECDPTDKVVRATYRPPEPTPQQAQLA